MDSYPQTPEGVVQKFCELDARGDRLSSNRPRDILDLISWEDMGAEFMSIVSGFEVGEAKVDGEQATVPVEYRYLGTTDAFTFTPEDKRRRTFNFTLSKIDGLWKLDGPVTMPHVYWEDAITFFAENWGKGEGERRKQVDRIIEQIRQEAGKN